MPVAEHGKSFLRMRAISKPPGFRFSLSGQKDKDLSTVIGKCGEGNGLFEKSGTCGKPKTQRVFGFVAMVPRLTTRSGQKLPDTIGS